jgi:hypothetical protein
LIRCSIDCVVDVTGIGSGGCERRFQSLDNTSARGISLYFAWRGVCKSIAAMLEHAGASGMCLCRGLCWDIDDNVQCFVKVILRKEEWRRCDVAKRVLSRPLPTATRKPRDFFSVTLNSMPNHSLTTLRYTRFKRTS